MSGNPSADCVSFQGSCCACGGHESWLGGITRRGFLGGAVASSAAFAGLAWASAAPAHVRGDPPPRKPLKVKPIFVYNVATPRPQTSWRHWGGIETQAQADEEAARIRQELDALQGEADFPLEFLPLAAIRSARELEDHPDVEQADTLLIYAAGGGTGDYNALGNLGKDLIFFVRHQSGPIYLWYEIISPRYLRQHTDALAVEGVDFQDVVVDRQDEILWRLRALGGLKNTRGSRIVAIGGLGGWSQPREKMAELVEDRWQLDVQDVGYDDLGRLIADARADQATVERARERAAQYLELPNTVLDTDPVQVERSFLLDDVFRRLMREADCGAITVHHCMGTIMQVSETTACLTLSLLNDAGFLAFCESDFVAIPAGILLGHICGKPVFLNNPCYPHRNLITLAHCTAPRKMDGQRDEPARIMTHFESDFGAAPKVDMPRGQVLTNIITDFAAEHWLGLRAEILDHPLLPICRSQIEIRYDCDSQVLAERMTGFHWMTCYGEYLREVGYALKRVPIGWEVL